MEIDILQLISEGENVELECKEARQGLPKALWETYSSFANTNGGIILLGVKQQGNKFEVSGVKVQKLLKEFWDLINSPQKVSINLLEDKDVQVENIEGKQVIKITVPRADRKQKPVYVGQNPLLGTYRRNYEGDYHCSPNEVKSMLADQSDILDSRVLENFNMNDINMDSFRNYRERFASLKPVHPWLGLNDRDFIERIGAWGKVRETGKEGLTVAGLLMFGNERSITEEFPHYFLEFREKTSKDMAVRWDYRTTSADGTWSGNIYDFYFKIINRLTDNINIPFKLEGYIRRDDTRVHEAIREALANALIHADYSGAQGIVIQKETTAFIFSNPGILRIPIEQALAGGISDPRNPRLFTMFFHVGVGERAGSGLGNIQLAWKEQNWRKPQLIEKFQPDRTELILRAKSLLPQESINFLVEALEEFYTSLSKDEILALVTAHQEGQVTNSRLQVLSEKSPVDTGKVLSSLVDKGLLIPDGQRRGMKYLLSNVFHDYLENNEGNSINNGGNSVNNEGNSVNNGGNSVNNEGNSINNGGNSVNNEGNSVNNEDNSVNSEEKIKEILQDISKVPREKKRIDINEMRSIILELCKVRPLTLRELGILLNRKEDGIRNNYLSSLKDEGKIRLMYPGQVNHPQQAYITVKED